MTENSTAPQVAANAIPRNYYTEPEMVEVNGLATAYRRKGAGEAVLFLHGAGFTRMWLPMYEQLSQSMDLIAPEHPGFGIHHDRIGSEASMIW